MEAQLKLIVDYIHEKKGIWITPTPPQNNYQHNLMLMMSQIAKQYFDTKNAS